MEEEVPGPEAWSADLDHALEGALRPLRNSHRPVGVLFSAGVDSALLAWELRTHPGVLLCTLGREESPDVLAARAGSERLELPWHALPFEETDVARAEELFARELDGVPSVQRSVLLSLALAIDLAPAPTLVCGQGVDELFLGYAHYRGLDPGPAERRSREDLEQLRTSDWPRTQRIARMVDKEVIAPYLDPAFTEAAQRIPVAVRLPGSAPKQFFREWAVGRGLPRELASRPKKALQYGSGLEKLLRRRNRRSVP